MLSRGAFRLLPPSRQQHQPSSSPARTALGPSRRRPVTRPTASAASASPTANGGGGAALSPKALELAAAAAAHQQRHAGAPPYRFTSACISRADETLGACEVDDDTDSDGRGGSSVAARAAATTTALPRQPQQSQERQQQQQRPHQRALLQWAAGGPRRCLIVKKAGVAAPRRKLLEIANWLAERGVACFVERAVHASEVPGLPPFDPRSTAVDFAITLGGDGTVLHLASMFDGEDTPLPPVVCFAMGTLGFLTAFAADDYAATLEHVLAGDKQPLYCTLRSRTRVDVLLPDDDAEDAREGSASADASYSSSSPDELQEEEEEEEGEDGSARRSRSRNRENNNRNTTTNRPAVRLSFTRHVLNECVIDRGAFPHAVYIEIFVDGVFLTVAEADGLVVATPSGSTAYSMSAGGSMVSPSVPCTLLTPLSPQSLSFRPLVIPESSELLISVPRYARSHARLSFDGRSGQRLPRGSALRVTTSACSLPFINVKPLDGDFYQAIVQKLKWTGSRTVGGGRPEPPIVVL